MSKKEKGREEKWVGNRRESKEDPPLALVLGDFDQQGQFRSAFSPDSPNSKYP